MSVDSAAAWPPARAAVRRRFPRIEADQFGTPRLYLNSAAGSLMVDSAVRALSEAALALNPMPGRVTPAEAATGELHERVRRLGADFLGARSAAEISFHSSSTAALSALAFAMRSVLGPESALVVTDLDHMANISPWEDYWGRERGRTVRRARVTPEGRLDLDHLLSAVDGRTGLLAVTMASNGLGTVVPLADVVRAVRAKAPGCLVVVDAVHHALHGPIDVAAIGCDALVFSGYKVFGPMLGVLYIEEGLGRRLAPYRVETNKDEPPFKFEMGMLNSAVLASLGAALEYWLELGGMLGLDGERTAGSAGERATRPARFRAVLESTAAYEETISRAALEGFRGLDPGAVRLFGLSDPDRAAERDPTFAFEVRGQSAEETKRRLWNGHGIQIADGNHYSAAVVRHLGRPALCRASFAHYDTTDAARRLVEALADISKP